MQQDTIRLNRVKKLPEIHFEIRKKVPGAVIFYLPQMAA